MGAESRLTITRPDDWHVHMRDGDLLSLVAPQTARQFGRALVMPNLRPPVQTVRQALAYRERILQALPGQSSFQPLMTLYLSDDTASGEIVQARATGVIPAAKLYPSGATTHSEHGVTDIRRLYRVFEAMQEHGMVLCVHGEVVDPDVDIFDREEIFIDTVLAPLVRDFPGLKVVLEHITTKAAVSFVESASSQVAATITPQHLLYERNHMLVGGIRPHLYCLPVLKRKEHQEALIRAATSGNPKFFLGTDSAPHLRSQKESACGCAGVYSAHAAIELYAEAFEKAGALDKLEGFASRHGADFYDLPHNTGSITLEKVSWEVPARLRMDDDELIPLRAGEAIGWRLGDLT